MPHYNISLFGTLIWLILIGVLTYLSQVGGFLFLVYTIIIYLLNPWKKLTIWRKWINNIFFFSFIYLIICSTLIPILAKKYNKVPLPIWSEFLTPQSIFYPLLNRHYVSMESRESLLEISRIFRMKYPNLKLAYLDGAHPIGNTRLQPHLQHKTGKKIDLCYFYVNDKKKVVKNPSWLGYGLFSPILEGETNQPKICKKSGSWWYSLTNVLSSDHLQKSYHIAKRENADLIKVINEHSNTKRIFVEPHLIERLSLGPYKKIRYHGCWAVRHDDHMHLEFSK